MKREKKMERKKEQADEKEKIRRGIEKNRKE